jgi:MFS family permease
VTSPVAGRLSARVPVRLLLSGGLALIGVALMLMSGIELGSSWTTLLAGFIIAGVGIGFVNAPLASTAVSVVEPRQAGMASGVNNTFRQVGIATGIAALGAIFQSRITSHLAASGKVPAVHVHQLAQAVSSGATQQALQAVPAPLRSQAKTLADSAFISGLNAILFVAAFVLFASAVLAFLLVRQQDLVPSGRPVAAESG